MLRRMSHDRKQGGKTRVIEIGVCAATGGRYYGQEKVQESNRKLFLRPKMMAKFAKNCRYEMQIACRQQSLCVTLNLFSPI